MNTKVIELTKPFDSAALECDGMTRVLRTVLSDNHISHTPKVGRVEWNGKYFSPHFWIELPNGDVVDYRLRMWFGGQAPHGVFNPEKSGVIYEGRTANMPVLTDFLFGVLAGKPRVAGVKEVVDKITKRIRDSELVQRLTDKVLRFIKTKHPSDDLTPEEVAAIYRQEDYGDDFDMPGGQELDVGWTNHAEYRCDLRDVDPSRVNETIRDFAETHPHQHKMVNLTNRSLGKAVVDVNTMTTPEEARVVTVMANDDIESSLLISTLSELGVVGLSKVAGPNDIRWQAVFMMGSSGSGKSHYREKTYLKYMKFKVVDPDALVMAHPDYDPERPYLLHEWSKDVSDVEFNSIISNGTGDPVVVDGTGRNPEGILRKMAAAKKNGYRIFLVYIWVPVEVSIWRNRNRSRFVPEEKIVNVYKGYDESFARLRGYADSFKVIPNYTSEDLRAAKKDIEVYPAPQKVRPPRPGDSDYGKDEMSKAASDVILFPGQGNGNDDGDQTHNYRLGSVKTFYQIDSEGGKKHEHHWRKTCVECGGVDTCRCSAPKVDVSGICYDCCEKEGIDFKTGKKIVISAVKDRQARIVDRLIQKVLERKL